MKCLILTESDSDLSRVLASCGAETERMTPSDALAADLGPYDSYCVLAGPVLDPRLRIRLEEENAKGKRIFTEALNS